MLENVTPIPNVLLQICLLSMRCEVLAEPTWARGAAGCCSLACLPTHTPLPVLGHQGCHSAQTSPTEAFWPCDHKLSQVFIALKAIIC